MLTGIDTIKRFERYQLSIIRAHYKLTKSTPRASLEINELVELVSYSPIRHPHISMLLIMMLVVFV